MKDILKFAGSTLLLMVTLIMVNMIFVQTLAGDSDLVCTLHTRRRVQARCFKRVAD